MRRDADGLDRRDLDDRLPRPAGRRRRAPVPGRAGDRRRPASRSASAAGRWRSSSAITGALTAVGPIAGGYLTEWTWRAIFWVNVPVAIIAIVLTLISKPSEERNPSRIDYRGALLVCGGMGLAVLGLQQASVWGWDGVATLAVPHRRAGAARRVRRASSCAIEQPAASRCACSPDRAFAVDNAVLFLLSICFVPLFFFASVYAQIALGESASGSRALPADLLRRLRHRRAVGRAVLDSRGARPAVVPGCAIAAVGFYLWGSELDRPLASTRSGTSSRSPASGSAWCSARSAPTRSTAPRARRYGEVTGITQTVRNFGASLGLAVLGSILITENVSRVEKTLGRVGVPKARADSIAHAISGAAQGSSSGGGASRAVNHQIRLDFAHSTQTVVYGMAAAMVLAFIVSLRAMPSGQAEQQLADQPPSEPAATPCS